MTAAQDPPVQQPPEIKAGCRLHTRRHPPFEEAEIEHRLRSLWLLEPGGNSGHRFGADRGVSAAFRRQRNQRIVDCCGLALSRLL
jgi:hypothetical protein